MVKVIIPLTKKADMNDNKFADYRLNKHGPLIVKVLSGM